MNQMDEQFAAPLPSVLDRIVAKKLTEIEAAKSRCSMEEVQVAAAKAAAPLDFFQAIKRDGNVSLIAEVKKASPSKGVIRDDFHPAKIATTYEQHGATCLSVLTDEHFFQGHLDFLRQVKDVVSIPVLRKEFILDPYQIYEARSAGADAVLLIAECLSASKLAEFRALIEELGMTALVELYDENNVQAVAESGARLVGINNRNLHTFETDLAHTFRLMKQFGDDRLIVGESGIRTREDVDRLAQNGVAAMLVGESLMAEANIGQAVDRLLGNSAN